MKTPAVWAAIVILTATGCASGARSNPSATPEFPGGTSSATPSPSASGSGASPSSTISSSPTLFQDPVGDVEGLRGPDITSLAVSHQSGNITFVITFTKPPTVSSEPAAEKDGLMFFITTVTRSDGKQEGFSGGGSVGMDLRFRHCAVPGCDEAFDGSGFVPVPSVVTGKTVSVTLSESFLHEPAQVNLKIAAIRFLGETGNGGGDGIPNSGEVSFAVPS